MLVVCCSAMLATSKLPKITHGGKVADAGVGLLGGVMAPLSGFSGLAPALWATLRGYTKDEHRAVLQNFNLAVLAATFASFVWTGRARAEHLPQMARGGRLADPAVALRLEDLRRHEPDRVPQRRAVAAGAAPASPCWSRRSGRCRDLPL